MAERSLAMFPLSSVLFPYARLALHVFEPRYRSLVADCLAGDSRFGVVLITRGSEVGGGDQRVEVGTEAAIDRAEPLGDGRWFLEARGLGLVRVTCWTDEAPYPRALVEDHATERSPDGDALQRAEAEVRRVRALLSELGDVPAVPGSMALGDTPDEVAWQLCALAPVNAFDRQRLLEIPGPDERLALLLDLVRAVGDDVGRMLAGG
jgi:uncharacterized protein